MPKNTKKIPRAVLIAIIIMLALIVVGGFWWYLSHNATIDRAVEQRSSAYEELTHITELIKIFNSNEPIDTFFVLQNDQELRPSGGFITAAGKAILEQGQILSLDLQPARAFEEKQKLKTPLPTPINQMLKTDYLTLRDANLSADFPTSMSNVSRFIEDINYSEPKLFVAINSTANEKLLALTGPITFAINNHTVTLDQNNATEELERLTDLDFAELGLNKQNRKQVLISYAQALLPQMQTLIQKHPLQYLSLVRELLKNYDVQAWSPDTNLEKHLSALNAAQIVGDTPPNTDHLMIVDGNYGSRKTDPLIEQKVEYKVSVEDTVHAQLSINYKNTAKETPLTTTYNDFIQIYVPANTKLVEQKGLNNFKQDQQFGLTRFSGNFSLTPGSSKIIQLNYVLSSDIYTNSKPQYVLYFERQPGGRVFPINYITSVDNKEKQIIFDSLKDAKIVLDKNN